MKPYKFKLKDNEVQASLNARLDETLPQAMYNIDTIPSDPAIAPAHQHVVESLHKGRALIQEWQMLILLADHSEHFNHAGI